MSARVLIAVLVLTVFAAGCSKALATVTPVSQAPPAQVVEIPIAPPPGAPGQVGIPNLPPLAIEALETYREPTGLYSLDTPAGWIPQTQTVASGDVKVGTLFQSPEGTGILTVTQFDNGQPPKTLGTTVNEILEMTGVTKLAGYQELSRTNVIERPEEALKLELTYTRSDGLPMHALVLFQVDGSVFSMVNAAVEGGSWGANLPRLHDLLATYRVPATTSG